VNYTGVREGARVQRIFTWLKIVGLLVLIGAAFLTPVSTSALPSPISRMHFGAAMAACLMAYNVLGLSFVAGEVRDPQREPFAVSGSRNGRSCRPLYLGQCHGRAGEGLQEYGA